MRVGKYYQQFGCQLPNVVNYQLSIINYQLIQVSDVIHPLYSKVRRYVGTRLVSLAEIFWSC